MIDLARRRRIALGVILAALLVSSVLFAQSSEISLRGQVKDPSGAVVPAVTVTAVAADGTKYEAQTNENGLY